MKYLDSHGIFYLYCILVDDDQFVKVAFDPDAFMQVLPGEAIQGDLTNEYDDLT